MSYDHPLSQKNPKKQGNKKSSEGGDWQGGWAKFEKEAGGGRGGGVGNIGDLDKIVGQEPPMPTMNSTCSIFLLINLPNVFSDAQPALLIILDIATPCDFAYDDTVALDDQEL